MREFGILNAFLKALDFSDHWSEIAVVANQYRDIKLVIESIGQHVRSDLHIDRLFGSIPNAVRVTTLRTLLIACPINDPTKMDGKIGELSESGQKFLLPRIL